MKSCVNILASGAMVSMMLIAGCKKSSTPGGGPGNTDVELRPVKVTFFQDGNDRYKTVFDYTYNADNRLTSYGNDINKRAIGVSEVIHSAYTPDQTSSRYYSYYTSVDMTEEGDIYTTPVRLSMRLEIKDNYTSAVNLIKLGTADLLYTAAGRLAKTIESGGRNTSYEYDENGNLKYVYYSDPPAGSAPYARIRVVALDDHPSPFSFVKAYDRASWPQGYASEFALAYCRNNPTRIIVENRDPSTGAWKPTEQSDFTYSYNQQGYPGRIVVDVSYFAPNLSPYRFTYDYTYQ